MTPKFEALKLKGAEVKQFRLSPGKNFALELMLLPQANAARREVHTVELVFEGLHRYDVRADAAPWLEVVSWRQIKESDFRRTFSPRSQAEGIPAVSVEDLGHFEIIFDGGSINLLAEDWTLRTIEILPVQDGPSCSL